MCFPHCVGGVCNNFLAEGVKMSYFKNNSTVKWENKLKPSNLFITSIGQVMRVMKKYGDANKQLSGIRHSCVEVIFGSICFYGILWHSECL